MDPAEGVVWGLGTISTPLNAYGAYNPPLRLAQCIFFADCPPPPPLISSSPFAEYTHEGGSPPRNSLQEGAPGTDAAPVAPKAPGKAGGAYIPPFRLAQMMQEADSKTDAAYQRLTWDALRKSINGLVNKANAVNIRPILKELLSEVSFEIALISECET